MATAVDVLRSAPSGVRLRAGLPVVLPAWVPDAGKFATISTGDAADANPCPGDSCVYSGTSGFAAVWTAWNGGAYAPTLGSLGSMLFFGGGHFSYHGNEVVRYELATRVFSRLSEPSLQGPGYTTDWPAGASSEAGPAAVGPYGQYNDGTPYPVHTNMGCDFLPPDAGGGTLGSYVFISHDQTGIDAEDECRIWRFDIAAALSAAPPWSVSNAITKFAAGNGGAQRPGLCQDSVRKGLWNLKTPTGGVSFYSFLTGAETDVPLNSGNSFSVNLSSNEASWIEHHPGRDFMLTCTAFDGALIVMDLSGYTLGTGFVPTHAATVTGTPPPAIAYDRPAYCSEDGCFYLLDWTSKTTAVLYKLTPPAGALTGTWTWSNETLTAQNGESLALMAVSGGRASSAALYGRFRWVPSIRCFVAHDGVSLPVQAFRPAAFV